MELFYSTGGHGGPYPDLDTAVQAAKRLLEGNPNERWIEVRSNSTALEAIVVVNRLELTGVKGTA